MRKSVQECKEILQSKEATVSEKYDALFHHEEWNTEEALAVLREAYPYLGKSELLQHEVLFILGKNARESSLDFIFGVLHSPAEAPIVRHEAAEALANFINFKDRVVPELLKYWDSDISVLRSTAWVAIRKLESFSTTSSSDNGYTPGASGPFSEEQLVAYLKSIEATEGSYMPLLLDDSVEEYAKFRAVYTLRKKEDKASVFLLSSLLLKTNQAKTSSLIRHEIGFILGELGEKAKYEEVRDAIRENVENPSEEPMVKHEVIIAYIRIWGVDDFIEKQKKDPCALISESAQVSSH